MKRIYLIIAVIMLISVFTGIFDLAQGIAARGWSGVNYGRVLFPVLLSGISLWQFIRSQ